MIKEIIKQTDKIILSFILLFLIGCTDNERLIQVHREDNLILTIHQTDHGAWGYTCTLRVYDATNSKPIESLGLRGQDYLPKIDSVVPPNIYIHYEYPRRIQNHKIEILSFESVDLGYYLDKRFKYNYIFRNVPPIIFHRNRPSKLR